MIQPNDGISLPENDLLMIEKARKSFGLIRIDAGTASPAAVPSGSPRDLAVADSEPVERKYAEQFPEMTKLLSPEDRIEFLVEATGNQRHDYKEEQENDRQLMNSLSDRAKEVCMVLEPQCNELSDVYGEAKTPMKNATIRNADKVEYADELAREARDMEEQLLMTIGVSKGIKLLVDNAIEPTDFNIASPNDIDVQRRLSSGTSSEPRFPPPVGARAAVCPSVRPVPSGQGNPPGTLHVDTRRGPITPRMPKAPPCVMNNVHTFSSLVPPPQIAEQACGCCNRFRKTGRTMLITQQSMADIIQRPPRRNPDDYDDDDSNGSSEES